MKKKNIVIILVMTLLLFGLSSLAVVSAPKHISDSERRELAQFPELSWESLQSGKFMDQFETYAQDQFPFRDMFRRLKAEVMYKLFQQKDNHQIYMANGHISEMIYPFNEKMQEHAAERFAWIHEHYLQPHGSKVYLSIIPDKNCFLAKDAGYLSLDYDQFIGDMREKVPFAKYIDVKSKLSLEQYYRTDTHWRQEEITDVAKTLAEAMGENLKQDYRKSKLDLPFRGVFAGRAAVKVEPENIYYLENEATDSLVVTCYDKGKPEQLPLYDEKKAGGKDPYEFFLSGTRAILTLENPLVEEGKELIVFRDSFGSSLIPLLAEAYHKITVIDIRYVQSSLLEQMVDFHGQDTLFLYSTLLLNNSLALK